MMRILQIAPECAPVAKAGGLADVVYGLGRALRKVGHEVAVVLPHYQKLFDHLPQRVLGTFEVPLDGELIPCQAVATSVGDLDLVLIGEQTDRGLLRSSSIYGAPNDLLRFTFFCQAVFYMMESLHWVVDILHVHDWATALVPVLAQTSWAEKGLVTGGCCLTLHNLESQGIAPASLLERLGLDQEMLAHLDRLGDPNRFGCINLLRGGIVFADALTTVSPTYAREVLQAPGGHGLEDVLQQYAFKLQGILNGLDFDYWNPATDPLLPIHYSEEEPGEIRAARHGMKRALQGRLGLEPSDRPLFMTVCRLVPQKGVELIRHAIQRVIQKGGQFVLQGSSPIPAIQAQFHADKLHRHSCRQIHYHLIPDEGLTHWMFAGSDFTLIPSIFEPCGLTQMIGLRYGTIPIVRETGGLADTVLDLEYGQGPVERRNGFTFKNADEGAIDWSLDRAFEWYDGRPQQLHEVQLRGMHEDHSWRLPAQHYLHIFGALCLGN
ncbi:MAG: glycogen synthase [Chlamydiia bacterium]